MRLLIIGLLVGLSAPAFSKQIFCEGEYATARGPAPFRVTLEHDSKDGHNLRMGMKGEDGRWIFDDEVSGLICAFHPRDGRAATCAAPANHDGELPAAMFTYAREEMMPLPGTPLALPLSQSFIDVKWGKITARGEWNIEREYRFDLKRCSKSSLK